MAAPSLRDRLVSRRGARAMLSPVGLVAGLVVAIGTAVAGLAVAAAAALGVAVWAANAWRMLPRAPRPERIDPFTLHDPWRRFVQEALQSRARFAQAVERAPAGPLRERLAEIGTRVDAGVQQCWLIARRGEALVSARRAIDVADLDRRLTDLGGEGGDARLVESLRAQRAAAHRLDRVIDRAETELRVLDARLAEAAARTLELSAHASTDAGETAVAGLVDSVDGVVAEMESLRRALDEADAAAGGGVAGSVGSGDPPPDGTV
jgi:hypothetical protein